MAEPNTPPALPVGAFGRMAWAFLFLGISIGPTYRFGTEQLALDVLPDCIGYLLIASAANRFLSSLRSARFVRDLALLLAFASIPTITQYTVITQESPTLTTFRSPIWPLYVFLGIGEMILVWNLCGMVAEFATLTRIPQFRERALKRRKIYIALKSALTILLTIIVLAPQPDWILPGVAAGIAIGIALLAMMMGLLRSADRIVEDDPPIDWEPTGAASGNGFRVAMIGGVLAPIALFIASCVYLWDWQELRAEENRKSSSSEYFAPAREQFFAAIRAGQLDDAYQLTTAGFRKRVTRGQFEERVNRFLEFQKLEAEARRSSGASMSSGSDSLTSRRYFETEKGQRWESTYTLRRDHDSIFTRTPPPVRVDDFEVEER